MNSRYIPFTQQRYCCVPACLQIVMYRRGLPLQSQDELGYALGLTVPEDEVKNYARVRTGKKPSSGWGTQIQNPKYEINGVLASLSIPLKVSVNTVIETVEMLRAELEKIQAADGDALVCFDYGVLWEQDIRAGHVCVFDRIDGDDVWLVDPLPFEPKSKRANITKLFEAIDFHGPHNSTGIWTISNCE